ncbi:MAG: hypothetical protein ACOH2B_11210 [Burkholderiaceae bacterium]
MQCAVAQDVGTVLSARYPPGSIATGDVAETALEQVATENTRIELEYAQAEQACREQFFVSACRDTAKERRRAALESIRPLKIEAETLIRRMRVADRDQALTEKHMEKAAEAIQFEQDALKKTQEIAQKQARNAEKDRERSQKTDLHVQDDRSRIVDHQVRQTRMQREVTADAQKRAANVAAYDKKIREAQAHQRDIAAKKIEKDRNRTIQPPVVAPVGATESVPLPHNPALAMPKP